MVNIISIVARVHASNVSFRSLEFRGSRRPEQCLGRGQHTREHKEFGERRNLSIGEHGTLAEDSEETYDIELQVAKVSQDPAEGVCWNVSVVGVLGNVIGVHGERGVQGGSLRGGFGKEKQLNVKMRREGEEMRIDTPEGFMVVLAGAA
jgi:hypothetical protein